MSDGIDVRAGLGHLGRMDLDATLALVGEDVVDQDVHDGRTTLWRDRSDRTGVTLAWVRECGQAALGAARGRRG